MNDYGFELLSDTDCDIEYFIDKGLLADENLSEDISASVNKSQYELYTQLHRI